MLVIDETENEEDIHLIDAICEEVSAPIAEITTDAPRKTKRRRHDP